MKRYCFALDLKEDPTLIAEYREPHKKVWPEILTGIRMWEPWRWRFTLRGTDPFMIMGTNDGFSFEMKSEADRNDPKVQEWETLMRKYQKALPLAVPGTKWTLMERIFKL